MTSAARILVVDDEPRMLRTVERVLAPRHSVRTARTAAGALEAAREQRPDLAILDIRMPDTDGFELMGRLRETCAGVDVIFMTGAVHELDAQLLRSIRERAFYFIQKPFDREILLTLVQRCLDQRKLARENRAHLTRLRDELEEARSFQASLLPREPAHFGPVQLAARYLPCTAMGGDFYDFLDAGRGRVALLIADVSGHGVSAAMLTGVVKSAFHDAELEGFEPGAVVRRVCGAIRPFDESRFVTLFCARLFTEEGILEYANAGHPAPFHVAAGRPPSPVGITGPMISPAFPDVAWETGRLELGPGERLVAYTDGLIEARGGEGFFGEERLRALVHESPAAGGALLDEVLEAVRRFAGGRPADDDQTLLVVERG